MMRFAAHRAQWLLAFFIVLLFVSARALGLPLEGLISDVLIRLPMNGVLVLSLLPMLNAGIGINFGLPVAISAGLLGMCMAVNFRMTGLLGFSAALGFSIPVAGLLGWLYGLLLRRVKGQEEITATFIGFSFVSLMNLFWAVAPFHNPAMLWPIGGHGMRPTIGLTPYFGRVLNGLFKVDAFGIAIPIGMLLFYSGICLLLVLFFKTRIGRAMLAVGENETFARICGVQVEKTRMAAVILSGILGAVGIGVYAQSYGFIELYDAPLMMAFPAASAVLIGGMQRVGLSRVSIWQAIVGTFLFQTIYVLSAPVANAFLIPESAEILRMIVTNSVILYAMTHRGESAS